jgi:poly-gamma-glutamate synthesis protein (capsule biosynthesis protein)
MKPYLLFGGDTVINEQASRRNIEGTLLSHEVSEVIKNASEFIVNLEAPFTTCNNEIMKNGPNIKCDPSYIQVLKNIGVSAVCLANNHMMDFADEGLTETLDVCSKANIKSVGAGQNYQESSKPILFSLNNQNIAVLNIAENEFGGVTDTSSGINTLNLIDNIKKIREIKKECDVLILNLHAGIEYFALPRPELQKICHFFIEEGVDTIICHHTHVASAYEIYNGKPVFYGIGNFIFENKQSNQSWEEGYLVKIYVNKNSEINFELVPYNQNISESGVRLLKDEELINFQKQISQLNTCLATKEDYLAKWTAFCQSKEMYYMTLLFFPFIYKPLKLLLKIPFLNAIVNPKSRIALRLNLIRCESHSEVIKHVLSTSYNKFNNK